MLLEKRRAARLINGKGASAITASMGWLDSKITMTAITIATLEIVMGIITTKP